MLNDKNDTINYESLCKKYPWIIERDHCCVLSPDSDGLLCGLFMSNYLNWKIVGFYDGKVSVINSKFVNKNPIFLDIEIFRKEIRSMGHHMLLLNKKHKPNEWTNFDNCLQPNNLRNYDGKNNFRLKYPLASIHFLVSVVAYKYREIKIPESAIPPLFFTDGVFNILFSYPENVLNWLHFMRIHEDWNPLKPIFENEKYSVFTLMKEMNEFFRRRDLISITKERGDRLRISNSDGSPANIESSGDAFCHINTAAKSRIIDFMAILADLTKWKYLIDNWQCWDEMKVYSFSKRDFKSDKKTLTIKNFLEFIQKNPLSWAMTSGDNIEYTLEIPDRLPR
jgi:hypothetical protein